MSRLHAVLLLILTALAVEVLPPAASAQTVQAWVSKSGSDGNPCLDTSPCRSFVAAVATVIPGGSIKCIDSGPYLGTFTITKPLTIDCSGPRASIRLENAGVVTINAGSPIGRVVLRGLDIEAGPSNISGVNGIHVVTGSVLVEDCLIDGFVLPGTNTGNGIYFAPSSGTNELVVRDSTITGNGSANSGAGITIKPAGAAKVRATITNSALDNNRIGILVTAAAPAAVTLGVTGTSASGNSLHGIAAYSSSNVNIQGVTIVANGSAGIYSNAAVVRVGSSLVTGNLFGVSGPVQSYGNNQLAGNTTQGSSTPVPTAGVP